MQQDIGIRLCRNKLGRTISQREIGSARMIAVEAMRVPQLRIVQVIVKLVDASIAKTLDRIDFRWDIAASVLVKESARAKRPANTVRDETSVCSCSTRRLTNRERV